MANFLLVYTTDEGDADAVARMTEGDDGVFAADPPPHAETPPSRDTPTAATAHRRAHMRLSTARL
jgi:hypothetical protein